MYMKKYITTSLLIISMFAGLMSNVGLPSSETHAKAAIVKVINLSKPSVSIAKKSSNINEICINKVKGATEYKIYRANSKNGTYKCIGTTTDDVFKDAVKGNKTCYYKVKACKNGKALSPYSKVVKAPSKKTTKTSTAPKTKTSTPTTTPSTKPQASTKPTTDSQTDSGYAGEVLKLVNQERAKAGLGALTTNATLQKAANKRAQEIVSSFSHTRPDGRSFSTVLGEYGISYRASGENIAWGQKTPSEVMNGWMNSSGHRANILGSQFGKVGIGVYKGNDGRIYWTQVFTN